MVPRQDVNLNQPCTPLLFCHAAACPTFAAGQALDRGNAKRKGPEGPRKLQTNSGCLKSPVSGQPIRKAVILKQQFKCFG